MPVLLYLVWIIFNGRLTLDVLLLGLPVCAGICWLMYKCGVYSPARDKKLVMLIPRIVVFLLTLLWQILLSNLHVIYLVLIADEISPRLVFYKPDVKTTAGKVALSSSITLTPGTLTVGIQEDVFCIHAIDKASTEGMEDAWSIHQLKRMEEMIR